MNNEQVEPGSPALTAAAFKGAGTAESFPLTFCWSLSLAQQRGRNHLSFGNATCGRKG